MTRKFAIISKPLQFFNVLNIPDVDKSIVLLITNTFNGAVDFFDKLKSETEYECYFFNSPREPFVWLADNSSENDILYINSDYGVKQTLWLWPLRNLVLFVYEEGIGTYRTDLNQRILPIRFLLKLVGFKSYFGGGRFTKGVYVYNPDLYLSTKKNYKKNVFSFTKPFLSHLHEFPYSHFIDSSKLEMSKFEGKKILLYLTSWELDQRVVDLLVDYKDYIKILKPHPHIKEVNSSFCKPFDIQIPSGDMIEFLLGNMLDIADKVMLVHHGSSSVEYFKKHIKYSEIVI